MFGLEQCVGESIPHEYQDQGLKDLQKTTAFEQDDLCLFIQHGNGLNVVGDRIMSVCLAACLWAR